MHRASIGRTSLCVNIIKSFNKMSFTNQRRFMNNLVLPEMSDENLQKNGFWLALNGKTHKSLFERVAQDKLCVCVPVAASMPSHVVFDKYYLGVFSD